MSLSDNSSGYEQTLCEKNLQLMELKFYIKDITRCLVIVYLISIRRLVHCGDIFRSQLYKYYINFKLGCGLQTKAYQYTSPKNYIPLYVSIHKHTIHLQWENHSIYWSYHYFHNTTTIYVKRLLLHQTPIHDQSIWSNIWIHACLIWSNIREMS